MQLTWYGHSAFRLDFNGKAVLLDPFFTGNPAFAGDRDAAIKGVDTIVLTHGLRRRFDARRCYAFAEECERFNQIFFVSNHFLTLNFN